MVSSKKVCVIGAGVSGLASARELLREGHDVTVMEQSGGVGGQWLYDPRTDAGDPHGAAGVHSSIYASVRLIGPREITAFSDFPFFPSDDGTGDARRYPGHAEFLRYIWDFCDAFGLMDVVRLNTKVLHVSLAPPRTMNDDGEKRWTVRCSSRHGDRDGDAVTTEEEEEVFDAVVVAAGQYTQPKLPAITGMDKWSRRQLHSHSYRSPDSFHGEVVVVVGFRLSGVEIALELCKEAREVHVGVRSMERVAPGASMAVSRHHNLHLHLQVERLCEDGRVIFAAAGGGGGSCVVVADSVIYCTGYEVTFPFLDTGGLVAVDGDRVGPLFEHTFPPALSFVGLPRMVLVPLFYEVQARWVAQALSGRRRLPAPEEMLRAAEEYHRAREAAGVPRRLSHSILFDFEYCDEFGEKHCGFPRPPEWKKELMRAAVARLRDGDAESYRDSYSYHDDGELVVEGLLSEGWLAAMDSVPQDKGGGVGQDEDDTS